MAAVEIDLNDGDDLTVGTVTICRDQAAEFVRLSFSVTGAVEGLLGRG